MPMTPQQLKRQKNEGSMTPKSLLFITITTTIYLIVELGFQSRLLDVAGTLVSMEEIEALEKFGRLISGTAIFLVFLGVVILPFAGKGSYHYPLIKVVVISLVSAVVIISSVFHGEKALVDYIVDHSSGEQRKVAAQALMIQNSVLNDIITIEGIKLSSDVLNTPEGKSFIALLPFLGSTIMVEGESKEPVIRNIIDHVVKNNFGNEKYFLENHIYPVLQQIKQTYNEHYVPASNKYLEAISQSAVNRTADESWQQYKKKLAGYNRTPGDIPESHWEKVRKEVRALGVDVPENWEPSDKISFYKAAKEAYRKKVDQKFAAESGKLLGFKPKSLPPGLSYAQFVNNKDIRTYLGKKNELLNKIDFSEKLTNKKLLDTLYYPLVKATVTDKTRKLFGKTKDYEAGGKFEEFGKTSMRGVVVPPMALFFSLIGGIVHFFKVIYYSLTFKLKTFIRLPVMAAGIAMIVFCISTMNLENSITKSPLYGSLESRMIGKNGYAVSTCMKAIIELAPYSYPINHGIRKNFLMDYNFR